MGGYLFPIEHVNCYGAKTATANTAIVRLVEPRPGLATIILDVDYTAGATAHSLYIMRALNRVTVNGAAAAGQAVINISADPGKYDAFGTINTANNLIAANDYCVYQTADGNYVVDTVSSVSTLAITMTNNVPTSGVLANAPFWWFGIQTDTNPNGGVAHPKFTLAASGTTSLGKNAADRVAGIMNTLGGLPGVLGGQSQGLPGQGASTVTGWNLNGKYEPVLIYADNITNAGTLERVTAGYGSKT